MQTAVVYPCCIPFIWKEFIKHIRMRNEEFNFNRRFRHISNITFSIVGRQNIPSITLYETIHLRPKERKF
jgi:hypothetical protein